MDEEVCLAANFDAPAFRGGDGTPGNPDYQSGIRGRNSPTVMCWPVERSAVRAACCARRRLIGVISLFMCNEVIPMFDPITRMSASWEPACEHGRRGQTLDDIRQLSCRYYQGRSGSEPDWRYMPIGSECSRSWQGEHGLGGEAAFKAGARFCSLSGPQIPSRGFELRCIALCSFNLGLRGEH